MNDDIVAQLIAGEANREREGLELIPSENYVSSDVLAALGSVFTNKYSEGYPGKRYYGGQEFTDQVEQLAIDRAKQLFGADHANVQPHSGAPANEAVYSAWCEPGDTILAMDLSHGGHLTHGSPVTRSAHLYNFVRYKMKDPATGEIDYDELRKVALEHRPRIILAGFSAYPRELDYQKFADIAREVGEDCLLMADMAHIAGLIAGGVAKNPLDYGFHVITTTTHKTLRGPRGGMIMLGKDFENPFGLKTPKGEIRMMSSLIDTAVFPGIQGGPLEHVIAAKAVSFFEILTDEYDAYAKQIIRNAQAMSKALVEKGYEIVSGGTDNHLMLIDLRNKNISGKKAEQVLVKADITVNKNMVPFDDKSAFVTSGIRVGVPAITSRGMKEEHMGQVVSWIDELLMDADNEARITKVRGAVNDFMKQFVLYPEL